MPSLGHLLCPESIDQREPTSSIDLVQYPTQPQPSLEFDASSRPNPRRCSVPDCQKTAKRGGRCIGHGGGNKCAVEGCTTSVVSRGLCVAHGGGKRCQTPECTKSAQSGGFCWVHGGGKKCGYRGCPKRAQSGGACIAHGGGKRCRIDGCNKVVQFDGLCVGHGGYRRCVFESCDKRAMANDFCQQHGGSSVCLQEHCYKRAVRGGMCSNHKTEASLQAVTASGLSTPSQSSDEDRSRRVSKSPMGTSTHQAPRSQPSQWRSKLNSEELSSKSSSELRAPTSCFTRHCLLNASSCSSRSPSMDQSPPRIRDTLRRGDSPVAPGFSALLNADNGFPLFSTFTKNFESSDRYVRQQLPHRHLEHKVYPKLPRIEALQNYRRETSKRGVSSSTFLSDSTLSTRPVQSELRIVVTEDLDRLKHCASGYQEDDSDEFFDEPSKLHVQSYWVRRHT